MCRCADISKAIRAGDTTWEGEYVRVMLQGILDDMETTAARIEYLNKPVKEGNQYRNYRVHYIDAYHGPAGDGLEMSSGHPLEANCDDEWHMDKLKSRRNLLFLRAGKAAA
jgi:hypothetical protein